MEKCPNPKQYPFQVDTKVRKFNRTHHAYSAVVDVKMPIDDTMSVSITFAA